ncbi:CynX/NimT family MFS transporter [Rhizobium sp. CG4]|uniref:MFS transporter n=1 Tax=Rhizobium sp. CG4 TaxID=2726075 RepID=UPI0020338A47|nr:MFS transporter [Rhizobium sp. CG4]MCM2458753.1 CynX/NimT family MFS transporter [Rhizobium sp. CG4]
MNKCPSSLLFFTSVILVGLNLRPILASIGPLLDGIQRDTGLNDSAASLLTTLPVVMMGVCLLGTSWLRRTIGEDRGILLGLALIFLGALARISGPTSTKLLLTATLGGIGIAIVQALMPTVVRRRAGSQTAQLMGLYSTAIMGGALLASMISPWLANIWGWPSALGAWALPALLAIASWLITRDSPQVIATSSALNIHRSPRAWALLAFFGLGTGAYTLVLAWLPPFFTQLGWSPQAAGNILGALTAAEVVAGIAVSLCVDRSHDRRPALLTALASLLVGMLMLCLAPLALAWPAAIFAGLGIGALFPLSLIVSLDHGEGSEAGVILGFVQGGGYVLAATLPFVAGILRQNLSDLTPAWWLMSGLCVVLASIAIRLRPTDRICSSEIQSTQSA